MHDRSPASLPSLGSSLGRVPTAVESALVFIAILMAVFGASALVSMAAVVMLQSRGIDVGKALENPATNPLANDPNWVVAGTLACELATLVVVVMALRRMRANVALVLPLRMPTVRGMFGGLLVTFGLLPLAAVASDLVSRLVGEESGAATVVLSSVRGASPIQMVLLVLGLAVVPAVVEESAFRGLITAGYRASGTQALFIPSLLFGIFHVDPAQAAATMVLGFGFGLARLCTGSLVTSMVAHAVYNATVLLLLYFSPDTAQGGTSLTELLAGLLVAMFGVWVLYPRRSALTPAVPRK